mmetsp:Transcript_15967/g.22056  ORF Transcript_15967/g.22056 Transcript_15967/m.22056 type:complete len:302 (+) Transcript_15967:277-1182(+)|eukprot:CAMPEP_0196592234 /NCGR_PEP_ID=MMETSP1081-20130531/72144_1 /TAXON_ID=36882 /ORGANISM="Pyramimonas amylifera, Strain CCMP720" /LENGTH=301 /DNA_ID=CAMNT_0041915849 /DNA_START=266 /DNA_END=1171 /DNA_ORIENTATION=+
MEEFKDAFSKSMFGSQINSTKPTNPAFGFGTSGRTSSTKLFFTKEQSMHNVGQISPGPIYDVQSSLGGQISSKNTSFPAFKFGARSLMDVNLAKESRPGPGTYAVEGSIGRQTASQRETAQSWKFGSSNRWASFKSDFKENYMTPGYDNPRLSKGWLGDASAFSFGTSGRHEVGQGIPGSKPTFRLSPGPGTYALQSSLGAQQLSQKNSASQFKFGTQTRERADKVYLTHAHERALFGQHSPAPNAYTLKSSLGNQLSSKNRTSSNFRFGSADRFSETKNVRDKEGGDVPAWTPGPGSYCV